MLDRAWLREQHGCGVDELAEFLLAAEAAGGPHCDPLPAP